MIKQLDQSHRYYRIAVFLSTVSVLFGVLREFLIVAKLGFSSANDELQIYLSIFYSISLALDAIRLAGLNLCEKLPSGKLFQCATIIYLPFTILVALAMCKFVGVWNWQMLIITILGSFMNLIVGLLITLKQRFGNYLGGQLVNLLPNLILIPGILIVFAINPKNIILALISLSVLIPFVQLLLLPLVKIERNPVIEKYSFMEAIKVFLRHLLSTLGEQLFQLVVRAASYRLGEGYLSVLAVSVRTYAAIRFILVDSYIGSKLLTWKQELVSQAKQENIFFGFYGQVIALILSSVAFFIPGNSLVYFSIKIGWVFMVSIYFMALVRILYFKLNRLLHDPRIVIKFSLYELLFAVSCLAMLKKFDVSLLLVFWLWYILKPFVQVKLLEPSFKKLVAN